MRILGAILYVLLVSGCASQSRESDVSYSSIFPEQTPEEIRGVWTGASGPYLMTILIKEDGTGIGCYSWDREQSVSGIRYSDDELYLQDDTKMSIVSVDGIFMEVKVPRAISKTTEFILDNDYRMASLYCQEEIGKLQE